MADWAKWGNSLGNTLAAAGSGFATGLNQGLLASMEAAAEEERFLKERDRRIAEERRLGSQAADLYMARFPGQRNYVPPPPLNTSLLDNRKDIFENFSLNEKAPNSFFTNVLNQGNNGFFNASSLAREEDISGANQGNNRFFNASSLAREEDISGANQGNNRLFNASSPTGGMSLYLSHMPQDGLLKQVFDAAEAFYPSEAQAMINLAKSGNRNAAEELMRRVAPKELNLREMEYIDPQTGNKYLRQYQYEMDDYGNPRMTPVGEPTYQGNINDAFNQRKKLIEMQNKADLDMAKSTALEQAVDKNNKDFFIENYLENGGDPVLADAAYQSYINNNMGIYFKILGLKKPEKPEDPGWFVSPSERKKREEYEKALEKYNDEVKGILEGYGLRPLARTTEPASAGNTQDSKVTPEYINKLKSIVTKDKDLKDLTTRVESDGSLVVSDSKTGETKTYPPEEVAKLFGLEF